MTRETHHRRLLLAAALLAVGTLFGETVIRQHPRDIPTYPTARQSYKGVKTKVAVCPLPIAGEMLTRALTNDGCRVVPAMPQCGHGMEDRPDCIIEPISLVSKTERDGASVSLVTVLIIRVRKPVSLGEAAIGRTFQGASRIKLGDRKANARGETETSQQEVAEGVRQSVENLLRIPELKAVVAETR